MLRVSLKDIAKKVGVSSATVSLVLNGKDKEGRIGKDVARLVRQAAKEMNYRPNMAARSLRTGKTKMLGLIVADISNPFFAKLARHIENIAGSNGYQVMFGSSDESKDKFDKLIDLFIEKNVDGLIVAPPQNAEASIMQLVKRDIPAVLVDRGIAGFPVSSVEIDNIGAAYSLTNLLIEKGCERIGFIAYNIKLSNIQKRYEGYKKSLEMHNIPFDENIVSFVAFENFEENIKEAVDRLLTGNVDSIVFATNRVGIQSLMCLRSHKQYRELQYASIDNLNEYNVSDLPITCIEQPIEGIGRRALDILFRHIANPEYDDIEHVILQVKIGK